MILLTVGTQLPFDRLVSTVDCWAMKHGANEEIVAQIGQSKYQPARLNYLAFLTPGQLEDLYKRARAIIAHAGTGSIISALEHGKPIIVMPRDHRLGEHRNAHQLSTADRFQHIDGVHVAYDEDQLVEQLTCLGRHEAVTRIASRAPSHFVDRLKLYFDEA